MPALAILGPRQCGKSTLARHIINKMPDTIYLDLEHTRDLRKLNDPEAFFEENRGKTICLDEIQRRPDLFPVMRSIIDVNNRNCQFIILGSASPELLRQSSETLAGRISYTELTPFLFRETGLTSLRELWLKGGYPRSFLEQDIIDSIDWRTDFIRTFLERDIPNLGFKIPANNIERLWRMCAHNTGQVVNCSTLAAALGISGHTVKSYIDLLSQTFMIRLLPPYLVNVKKRLIKSPKLYIRDTGILHSLLEVDNMNELIGHPIYGASWESFAIENIVAPLRRWKCYFYRTSSGNEIDLVLQRGRRIIAVECKASSSPVLNKGFYIAQDDIKPESSWIIAPVTEKYTFN
ncbi:MAG TPA: ATP-binding protein, partial [Spirochaetales bacterium]|nr:ATP-binding protein [Spirochaetales bacterium]